MARRSHQPLKRSHRKTRSIRRRARTRKIGRPKKRRRRRTCTSRRHFLTRRSPPMSNVGKHLRTKEDHLRTKNKIRRQPTRRMRRQGIGMSFLARRSHQPLKRSQRQKKGQGTGMSCLARMSHQPLKEHANLEGVFLSGLGFRFVASWMRAHWLQVVDLTVMSLHFIHFTVETTSIQFCVCCVILSTVLHQPYQHVMCICIINI